MPWLNWPLHDKKVLGKTTNNPKEQKNYSKLPRQDFALAQSLTRFPTKPSERVQRTRWESAWSPVPHTKNSNQHQNWLHFGDQNSHIQTWIDSTQKRQKDINKDFSKMELESPKIYELSHHSRQHHQGKTTASITKTSDGQNVQNHSRTRMLKTT